MFGLSMGSSLPTITGKSIKFKGSVVKPPEDLQKLETEFKNQKFRNTELYEELLSERSTFHNSGAVYLENSISLKGKKISTISNHKDNLYLQGEKSIKGGTAGVLDSNYTNFLITKGQGVYLYNKSSSEITFLGNNLGLQSYTNNGNWELVLTGTSKLIKINQRGIEFIKN